MVKNIKSFIALPFLIGVHYMQAAVTAATTDLIVAIKRADEKGVQNALQAGANPQEIINEKNHTVLMLAIDTFADRMKLRKNLKQFGKFAIPIGFIDLAVLAAIYHDAQPGAADVAGYNPLTHFVNGAENIFKNDANNRYPTVRRRLAGTATVVLPIAAGSLAYIWSWLLGSKMGLGTFVWSYGVGVAKRLRIIKMIVDYTKPNDPHLREALKMIADYASEFSSSDFVIDRLKEIEIQVAHKANPQDIRI